jgi:hypothetical protein
VHSLKFQLCASVIICGTLKKNDYVVPCWKSFTSMPSDVAYLKRKKCRSFEDSERSMAELKTFFSRPFSSG